MTTEVPDEHPRSESLRTRHRIEDGVDAGLTHRQGLIAEGRGEAFDYLLGERTTESAERAERAAAAHLLLADCPVLSVNGNAAALVPDEIVDLADAVEAAIEANLFNRTDERIDAIADHLRAHGAEGVKGRRADARIPGLTSERAKVASDGIHAADVVLVPLEDGDRAEALSAMDKTEIVVDLNPLSRSPQVAAVPVIDNLVRAMPNIAAHARELAGRPDDCERAIENFDREAALEAAEETIRSGELD
ncbi:phosphopantothenate/pantothenate synthetase [Halococcus sp. AFM35]|uniref:phosphopantothenate/pantothenate synthetase n=1 Tax=Halococcus sp. AFM35 TaxID=3421653 RepID=UPI003EBE484C